MLSWWMKTLSHSIDVKDIVTKLVPLYSLYQAPSYEPICMLLAPVSVELSYLVMLFIFELACTACSAGQLKNKQHSQIGQLWQKPVLAV